MGTGRGQRTRHTLLPYTAAAAGTSGNWMTGPHWPWPTYGGGDGGGAVKGGEGRAGGGLFLICGGDGFERCEGGLGLGGLG